MTDSSTAKCQAGGPDPQDAKELSKTNFVVFVRSAGLGPFCQPRAKELFKNNLSVLQQLLRLRFRLKWRFSPNSWIEA